MMSCVVIVVLVVSVMGMVFHGRTARNVGSVLALFLYVFSARV